MSSLDHSSSEAKAQFTILAHKHNIPYTLITEQSWQALGSEVLAE